MVTPPHTFAMRRFCPVVSLLRWTSTCPPSSSPFRGRCATGWSPRCSTGARPRPPACCRTTRSTASRFRPWAAGRRVAVIELTEVRVVRLGDVDVDHARDEGEGHRSVAEWRAGHEGYWHGADYRGWLGDAAFTVDDDTPVVLERFRLVAVL